MFIVAGHLLTTYRLNIYVRFLNVPSPEQGLERAVRASRIRNFFSHVLLRCRRILIGFALGNDRRVPAAGDGPLAGGGGPHPHSYFRDGGARADPCHAWVRCRSCVASNEESTSSAPSSLVLPGYSSKPTLNGRHGRPGVGTGAMPGCARGVDLREVDFTAAPPHFTGLTVGMGVAWVS